MVEYGEQISKMNHNTGPSFPELLRRPLWIFDLPDNLGDSLKPIGDYAPDSSKTEDTALSIDDDANDSPDSSDDGEDDDKPLEHDQTISNGPSGPMLWLTSPKIGSTWLGIYKVVYPLYLQLQKTKEFLSVGPFFFCLTGGGHFAAAVVTLNGNLLRTKTFHRYTTRRKQGGAQGASDAAKGAAHSAGSSLRRYNEAALANEVRELLKSWKADIDTASLLFVRATGTSNRRMLFGTHEGQALRSTDSRIRKIPFSTRRATQQEIIRCLNELVHLRIAVVDPQPQKKPELTASKPAVARPRSPELSEEEQAALLHTGQVISLIRRSKAPALLSYLQSNNISPSYQLYPPSDHYHAPTILHLAASSNSPAVVTALLMRANADPTIKSGEGRTSFELAGDKATRDAFRVARFDLGDSRWDWSAAKVPLGMSRSDIDAKAKAEKQAEEEAESARRKLETAKLTEKPSTTSSKKPALSAKEKREAEAKGMTPEMRAQLERERRARAAEARMKAAASNS